MDPRVDCTNFLPSTIYAEVKTFTDTIEIIGSGGNDPVFYPVYYMNPGNFLNGVLQVYIPENISNFYPIVVINRNLTLPNGYMFSIICNGEIGDRVVIMDATKISTIDPPLAILTDNSVESAEGEPVPYRKMVTLMVTRPEGVETGEYTLISLDVPIPKVIVPVVEYPTQHFPSVLVGYDSAVGKFIPTPFDEALGRTLEVRDPGQSWDSQLYLPRWNHSDAKIPALGQEYRLLNRLGRNVSLAFKPVFEFTLNFISPWGYGDTQWRTLNTYKQAHPDASFTLLNDGFIFDLGDAGSDESDCHIVGFPLALEWDGKTLPSNVRVKIRVDSITYLYSQEDVIVGLGATELNDNPMMVPYDYIQIGQEHILYPNKWFSHLFMGGVSAGQVIQHIDVKIWLETELDVWVGVKEYYNYHTPIAHKLRNQYSRPYIVKGGYARAVISDIAYAGEPGSAVTEISWSLFGDING